MNTKRFKVDILDVLLILWTFSSAAISFVLYLFNIQSNSGQLAIIYIIVAIVSSFFCFKNFSRMIPLGFLAVFLLFITVGFSFLFTNARYGMSEAKFVSEFKAYFAMAICTVLLTLLIAWRKKKDISLNLVFVAVIILTSISFIALFSSDSATSGGYILDSSGMIYQNISYYSAHAFGLTLFHMYESKQLKPLSMIYKFVCFVLFVIQTSTCFLSGGRGGLVLLGVLFIFGIFLNFGKKSYKIIIPLILFYLITRFTIPWLVGLLNINIKGLNRILSFLNGDLLDDGRVSLYSQSLELFRENPLVGNGIGSIFYHMHSFSHNMFLDILTETGVVGLSIFLMIMFFFTVKMISLFKQGSLFRFLTIIFICGMTLNLFSGYVWANPHFWLPVAVALSIQNHDYSHDKQQMIASDTVVQYSNHSLESENDG